MINYNKNKLINKTLDKYYETFEHTLDTADYVPEKFNNKIAKYIFKNMKRTFKKINKEDKKFQKEFNKKEREKALLEKEQSKPKKKRRGFFQKFFKRVERKNADSNNNS